MQPEVTTNDATVPGTVFQDVQVPHAEEKSLNTYCGHLNHVRDMERDSYIQWTNTNACVNDV